MFMTDKKQAKGVYLLVIKLKKKHKISPGRLPQTTFRPGVYLYIGRAKNGLKGRLLRHLRKEKKPFWHIDFLLQKGEIEEVWIKPDFFEECQIAREIKNLLNDSFFPLKKFGSSDCNCPSHLLSVPKDKVDFTILRKKLSFEKIGYYGTQV